MMEAERKDDPSDHPRQSEEWKDKGWAWVVCGAVFVTLFLSLGYIRIFGILFVSFQTEFNSSSSATASIMGVYAVVYSVMSLVSCNVMLERFSARQVTMAGGIIVSVGVALDVFATSISFLMCTNGIIVGIGNAMVFGPSIVILGTYFERRRTFATAVAFSGACIGGICLPPLVRFMIDQLGIRGAKLIFGAIVLNVVPAALLQWAPRRRTVQFEVTLDEESKQLLTVDGHSISAAKDGDKLNRTNLTQRLERTSFSLYDVPFAILNERKLSISTDPASVANLNKSLPSNLNHGRLYDKPFLCNETDSTPCVQNGSINQDEDCMQRTKNEEPVQEKRTKLSKIWSTLDTSLFKLPLFWSFIGFHLFGYAGVVSFPFFLPPIAKENGISDVQSALLVSLHAGLDLVCRIVTGLIADFGWVQRYKILATAYIILGLVYQFVKYYTTFELMVLYVVVFGTFSGSFYSLHPSIAVDYFGEDKFAKVFGYVQFFHGVVQAISYPLIGVLRDVTGSYVIACHLNGTSFFVAALLLFVKPLLENNKRKRNV